MDRRRLTSSLTPLVWLAVCGTAQAAEVFPQPSPQEMLQSAQPTTLQRLESAVGQRPPESAATLQLTQTDREQIELDNRKARSGAPMRVGVLKSLDVRVDLKPIDVPAMGDQTYAFERGYTRRAEGKLNWLMSLDALEAGGARLRFDDVKLPADAVIHVYNEAGDVHSYKNQGTRFWSKSIVGERVYIQVEVPEAAADDVSFHIGAAVLFHPSLKGFCPDNAHCIEDGSCHTAAEWSEIDKVRKAIAHINFIKDEGSYICTGGLLADTDPETTIPYFLTANHCISDPMVAATVETWFDYQTPFCNSGCPPLLPGTATTLGATLIHGSAVNDHTLLVLDEPPPADAWYLGWNSTPVTLTDGTMLFRLSHPQGSPQAYSAHLIDRNIDPTNYCGNTPGFRRGPFIFSRDLVGSTEGGSSGSPVLTANGQVVGQLYGGCGFNLDDVCDAKSNITVDGAFAHYYQDVAPWLSPDPLQLPLMVRKFGTGNGRVVSSINSDDPASGTATPQLLGGTPVEQTDWPWQAALEITTWRLNGEWNCGGSVIHPNWILTAAHCVVDYIDERFATVSPSNIAVRTGSTRFEYGGQESKVKRIVKHPEFDPLTREHDIALLELKSPVFADPIRPVTWEREPSLACPGINGAVTGWTAADLCGISAAQLSKVEAAIVDPDQCRSAHDGAVITTDMLCTTSSAANDDCQLDNGSPLVVANGRGGYAQAGIVSWGNDCEENTPTIHTRLASHVEWMESVTGQDFTSAVGPNVIDCGSTCQGQFAKDMVVTLTAEPDPGSTFGGWQGACGGEEPSCQVTMTQALNVKAIFNAQRTRASSCTP